MKKNALILSTTIFLLVVLFAACKKENSPAGNDNTAEASAQSDDQARFSSEVDAVANDADLALESSANFTGRMNGVQTIICDATLVFDTVSNPRKITITYNGSNCWGTRTRSGVVVLSMDVQNDLGSITVGKRANLIFTKQIPSLAYLPYSFGSNLIDKVMINGEFI